MFGFRLRHHLYNIIAPCRMRMRHDDMICYLPLFITENLNISPLGGNPFLPTFDIKIHKSRDK